MYKAVFLDLDGTLLDDNKNISQENYDAIEYVTKNNGFVILSSGRPISATRIFWEKTKASRYFIYSNGAGIFDTQANETIFSAIIEKNICLDLYNYAISNNLCIRFDTPYGRYITDLDYSINTDVILNEDIIEFLNKEDILQISFLTKIKNNIFENAIDYINKKYNHFIKIENRYTFINKNNEYIYTFNLVNTITSKGNAISGLCKFLHIDINDTIAIGDDLNDISMIKTVGLGVAMENAKPEVKKVAKQITIDNNHSGVAKILREYFTF